MTKVEFLKKIQEFNLQELTKTDIYQIGLMHKSLPKTDRDWTWIAELVNWEGSSESLRNWVNHRMKKEGILPSALTYNAIQTANSDELTKKKEELFIQQQKTRDEWTTYRRLLREDARIDSLKDSIRLTVQELTKLPKFTYKATSKMPLSSEAVLLLSDLHIGAYVDSFYNKYNIEIATKRLEHVVQNVINYCQQHHVKKLTVLNLGDAIQGIIHTTGRIDQETDVVSQVMIAGELIATAMNCLQAAAPQVVYRSCTDNHARVVADIKQNIEKENFSKLIDWFIEERLKATNIMFVNDNLDDDIGFFRLLNNKTMLFVHGHRDKDFSRTVLGISSKLNTKIDYMCLAHFHASALKTIQGTLVFTNSSLMGSDEYASSVRLYGPAAQTLLIFEDANILNININLDTIQ